MAEPALKLPNEPSNEALDILKRIEPALARISADISRIDERQRKQGEDIAELKWILKSVALREDVARIDGRLGELSARVPSIWTTAAMIVYLFGAGFVLVRFAIGI